MIMKCSCKSEFQDKEHGIGMRVHNPMSAKNGGKFRCTVCGSMKAYEQPKMLTSGQSMVEYVLVIVLVAIVVYAVIVLLGPIVGNMFSKINSGFGQ
jgi:Flp pilus assembly pilin Flp